MDEYNGYNKVSKNNWLLGQKFMLKKREIKKEEIKKEDNNKECNKREEMLTYNQFVRACLKLCNNCNNNCNNNTITYNDMRHDIKKCGGYIKYKRFYNKCVNVSNSDIIKKIMNY
jgi:hypothetical protein